MQEFQELVEGSNREPDDVVVVSFDFLDEYTSKALCRAPTHQLALRSHRGEIADLYSKSPSPIHALSILHIRLKHMFRTIGKMHQRPLIYTLNLVARALEYREHHDDPSDDFADMAVEVHEHAEVVFFRRRLFEEVLAGGGEEGVGDVGGDGLDVGEDYGVGWWIEVRIGL